MPKTQFDAVVIECRPRRLSRREMPGSANIKVPTAIIEREYMGGVCLNVGAHADKAVIHTAKTFDKMSIART